MPCTEQISFCVDLSYLYSKLVTTYSRGVDSSETTQEGPEEQEPLLPLSQARLPHLSHGVRQFMAMSVVSAFRLFISG